MNSAALTDSQKDVGSAADPWGSGRGRYRAQRLPGGLELMCVIHTAGAKCSAVSKQHWGSEGKRAVSGLFNRQERERGCHFRQPLLLLLCSHRTRPFPFPPALTMSSQRCRGESGLPALCAPALNRACGVAYPCAVSIATPQRLFSGKLEAVIAAGGPLRGSWVQLLLLDPTAMETAVHRSGVGARHHYAPHGLTFMLMCLQRENALVLPKLRKVSHTQLGWGSSEKKLCLAKSL